MGISPKDIKILWGKAAGRCAITRKKVLEQGSASVASKDVVIGEACHIVAESPSGPRGESVLSSDDRNRYPNLILLSADLHTLIDKDPAAWPIERLHQIKADHELWVEEQLTVAKSHEDEVYATFIEEIGVRMQLTNWDWYTDTAARGMLHEKLAEGADYLTVHLAKVIWPRKYPELESAIENLVQRFAKYVQWQLRHARFERSPYWIQDKFYRSFGDEYVSLAAARTFDLWQQVCRRLLYDVSRALNAYADQVRATLKPDYFYVQGRFGVMEINLFEGSFAVPTTYQNPTELEDTYRRWMKLLNQKEGPSTIFAEDEELQKKL